MTVSWAASAIGSGRLIASPDAGQPVTAASLIKLPILVAVLAQVDAGVLAIDAVAPIEAQHRVGGTGWLAATGRTAADLETLARAMIDSSDNTATNVLIDIVGFPAVAAASAAAGLRHTELNRHMMDAAAREHGRENTTTARDMVTLLAALPDLLAPSSYRLALDALRAQRIHGCLVDACPPGHELAHKTGTLDGINHDTGLLLHDGVPVVALAVLGSCTPGQEDELAPMLATTARDVVAQVLS